MLSALKSQAARRVQRLQVVNCTVNPRLYRNVVYFVFCLFILFVVD